MNSFFEFFNPSFNPSIKHIYKHELTIFRSIGLQYHTESSPPKSAVSGDLFLLLNLPQQITTFIIIIGDDSSISWDEIEQKNIKAKVIKCLWTCYEKTIIAGQFWMLHVLLLNYIRDTCSSSKYYRKLLTQINYLFSNQFGMLKMWASVMKNSIWWAVMWRSFKVINISYICLISWERFENS